MTDDGQHVITTVHLSLRLRCTKTHCHILVENNLTPTDRPKSVRNRCVIELFCGVVYVVTLPVWHFCWCMGFCHRTESDLFLFLLYAKSARKRKKSDSVLLQRFSPIFERWKFNTILRSTYPIATALYTTEARSCATKHNRCVITVKAPSWSRCFSYCTTTKHKWHVTMYVQ